MQLDEDGEPLVSMLPGTVRLCPMVLGLMVQKTWPLHLMSLGTSFRMAVVQFTANLRYQNQSGAPE